MTVKTAASSAGWAEFVLALDLLVLDAACACAVPVALFAAPVAPEPRPQGAIVTVLV